MLVELPKELWQAPEPTIASAAAKPNAPPASLEASPPTEATTEAQEIASAPPMSSYPPESRRWGLMGALLSAGVGLGLVAYYLHRRPEPNKAAARRERATH
jgi:hypothetical protein